MANGNIFISPSLQEAMERMNDCVIKIWDERIQDRFNRGDINMEMDLQAIFRSELEQECMEKSKDSLWGCYHDLMLRYYSDERYDLVLMHYQKNGDIIDYKQHFPAIVIEFKVWPNSTDLFHADFKKIEDLRNELAIEQVNGYKGKPYACHLMCIIDSTGDQWPKYFKEKEISFSELRLDGLKIKTEKSQWCRYQGRMPWYPNQIPQSKNRKILLVRHSWPKA